MSVSTKVFCGKCFSKISTRLATTINFLPRNLNSLAISNPIPLEAPTTKYRPIFKRCNRLIKPTH